MPLLNFANIAPKLGEGVFLAPTAWVIGNVEIGDEVSIFFGSTLRGDIEKICVGAGSNIQEQCTLHTSHGLICAVGNQVTVGHGAVLHSCQIQDLCLIGMNATVLDGAIIGERSIVGAGSLVPMRFTAPPQSLIYGNPAKFIRSLKPKELEYLSESAKRYVEKGKEYAGLVPVNM